ncbi:MAG: hypothetical protein CV090_07755 [Nitrospira sp. WS238]|nr:hypothetical protein [Nitrospira sp. WS238]
MKPTFNHKIWLAGLVIAILLTPVSGEAGAVPPRNGWIEQLTGYVVVQQGAALVNGEPVMFDLYRDQLTLVRRSYENSDQQGTYTAMNRFMDMLETREGGIGAKAADAIWDYCYEVTPPVLHDVKRHKQWWDKTVNWKKFFWKE